MPGRRTKRDPNHPKRPSSAYIFFGNELRPTLKAEKPDLTFGEMAPLISSQWNGLPVADRARFEAMAQKDRKRYDAEMAKYVPPPPNQYDSEDDDDDENGNGKKRRGKKARRDPAEPRRPCSAYILFTMARRSQVTSKNPELKAKEVMTQLGAMWTAMTDDEKKDYYLRAEHDKKRYQEELAAYKRGKVGNAGEK